MKRPGDAIEILQKTIPQGLDPYLREILRHLETVESELAGYRSRDDSGFKRSLENQG